MKIKYTGDLDEVTVRGVTFKAGKAVDLSDNPDLAKKMIAWPDVVEVKRGRKANDQDKS